MEKLKLIFIAGVTILFVGSSFMALFGAGKTLDAVLKTYVFKVEDCRYDYTQKPLSNNKGEFVAYEEPKEICEINYNQTKREIAGGLSMFLVALPVALIMFWQGIRIWKNTKKAKDENLIK